MPFQIVEAPQVKSHFNSCTRRQRNIIRDAVAEQLRHEPLRETSVRKKLRDNPLASYELRLGDYRVFYNVSPEELLVTVVAVGVKIHNKLYIDGKEHTL